MNNNELKIFTRGAYDLQKLRVMTGNRLAANFHAKLGRKPNESEEVLEEEATNILKDLRNSHKKLTDGLKSLPRQKSFKGDDVITSYTELCLVDEYIQLEKREDAHFTQLKYFLAGIPIYETFLKEVRGCGPKISALIIALIDIHKAQYPSSLWAYSGYDVASDGQGRSKKAQHLVPRTYLNKDGVEKETKGITFNPELKKSLYLLATCFIKCGSTYAETYYHYKHRLEQHETWKDRSKGHRHNAAMRYMVKRFLVDLYTNWRALENLPVAEEYSVAKLGKTHKVA